MLAERLRCCGISRDAAVNGRVKDLTRAMHGETGWAASSECRMSAMKKAKRVNNRGKTKKLSSGMTWRVNRRCGLYACRRRRRAWR